MLVNHREQPEKEEELHKGGSSASLFFLLRPFSVVKKIFAMKMLPIILMLAVISSITSNAQETTAENLTSKVYTTRPGSLGIIGDTADVTTSTQPGSVLMGGGKDVETAFQWMIDRSGGGNVVIIRASGTNAYNPFVYRLGKVSSVETLKIDTKELAENPDVVRIIRNAEMLFIAGGDQSVYMNQWKGTKTAEAMHYLINIKKVPFGGTSAGCAILGAIYYSGEGGSAVSEKLLANPYDTLVRLYKNDFLQIPYLQNVITDQHFITRNRQGRLVVFISRIIKDWKIFPKAIAADERTAVCINGNGIAKVFGSGKAYFVVSRRGRSPEICETGKPLKWKRKQQALTVYELQGTTWGNGSFNVKNFKSPAASGGNWQYWWVDGGVLKTAAR